MGPAVYAPAPARSTHRGPRGAIQAFSELVNPVHVIREDATRQRAGYTRLMGSAMLPYFLYLLFMVQTLVLMLTELWRLQLF